MPSIARHSVFLLIALCGTPLRAQAAPPADLVLRHGAIYTMAASRGWAEAVAISGSRLVFVGADRDVAAFVGPKTQVVDLGGRFVLPGFHDSHVHLVSGGIELGQCDLNGSKTGDEVLARVKACAAAKPDAPWIVGGGWDLPLFPQANPGKRLLDEIVPDRPVYLSAADGHSAWVNSKALAIAGITRVTPDPPRGRIERDAEPRAPNRGFPKRGSTCRRSWRPIRSAAPTRISRRRRAVRSKRASSPI